jgi:hypothetical protein
VSETEQDKEISKLADLAAALGEHVLDLDRRIAALETQGVAPKRIAASDLRRVTKGLMSLSLLRRRRLREAGRKL